MVTPKVISASVVQQKIGEVWRRVGYGEHLIIEHGGLPVAVIIPFSDYKSLTKTQNLKPGGQNKG